MPVDTVPAYVTNVLGVVAVADGADSNVKVNPVNPTDVYCNVQL
jgi:hypothetical protein